MLAIRVGRHFNFDNYVFEITNIDATMVTAVSFDMGMTLIMPLDEIRRVFYAQTGEAEEG